MQKRPFTELGLSPELLKAVAHVGYEVASPIQTAAMRRIGADEALLLATSAIARAGGRPPSLGCRGPGGGGAAAASPNARSIAHR